MRLLLSDLVALVRRMARFLAAYHSPRQLAMGATLGMILGLVPKANLIALTLLVLLLLLRVNKGLGLAAAVVSSLLGPWSDPFTHKLGLVVLGYEPLHSTYAALYDLPLAPWLGLHNTVVMGTLLVGLYLAYPMYYATWLAAARWQSADHVIQDMQHQPFCRAGGRSGRVA
jgi:uncharacterized protein (TIGR03546 family)